MHCEYVVTRILCVGAAGDAERLLRGLRDAGQEVIVVADGAPEAMAAAAVQEDVDLVVVVDRAAETAAALAALGAVDVQVHTLVAGATSDSIVDLLS